MSVVGRSPFEYLLNAPSGGGVAAAFQEGEAAASRQATEEVNRASQRLNQQLTGLSISEFQANAPLRTAERQRMLGLYRDEGEDPSGRLPGSNLGTAPGGALTGTASLIAGFERFRPTPYEDMTMRGGQRVSAGLRTGYGSDTITRPDGTVVRVAPGMQVSEEDARRDLIRRIDTEFTPRATQAVGAETWATLPVQAQEALVSITYNYGSLPRSVAAAAKTGDVARIAAAVEGLATDNSGINRERRFAEAAHIRSALAGGQAGAPAATPAPQTQPQAQPQAQPRAIPDIPGMLGEAPMRLSAAGVPMTGVPEGDLQPTTGAQAQAGLSQSGTAQTPGGATVQVPGVPGAPAAPQTYLEQVGFITQYGTPEERRKLDAAFAERDTAVRLAKTADVAAQVTQRRASAGTPGGATVQVPGVPGAAPMIDASGFFPGTEPIPGGYSGLVPNWVTEGIPLRAGAYRVPEPAPVATTGGAIYAAPSQLTLGGAAPTLAPTFGSAPAATTMAGGTGMAGAISPTPFAGQRQGLLPTAAQQEEQRRTRTAAQQPDIFTGLAITGPALQGLQQLDAQRADLQRQYARVRFAPAENRPALRQKIEAEARTLEMQAQGFRTELAIGQLSSGDVRPLNDVFQQMYGARLGGSQLTPVQQGGRTVGYQFVGPRGPTSRVLSPEELALAARSAFSETFRKQQQESIKAQREVTLEGIKADLKEMAQARREVIVEKLKRSYPNFELVKGENDTFVVFDKSTGQRVGIISKPTRDAQGATIKNPAWTADFVPLNVVPIQ